MKPLFFTCKLFVITALTLINPLWSQTYVVEGKVSTSTIPVHYASVTFIEKSDTTKKFSAITDSAGNYKLSVVTGVSSQPAVVPQSIELAQNYPNPFSSTTAISYQLNKQNDVQVAVYDILGREVKTFKVGLQTPGTHAVHWDGKDNFGTRIASGVYFYRLQTAHETSVKKMVFAGGSVTVDVPLFGRFSSERNEKQIIDKKVSAEGQYTIRITNIDSTQPKIAFIELLNITIQHDTTMNFIVQEAKQWEFLGLENETVAAIAVDPIDPRIIYAGTLYDFSAGIDGKLFKSRNCGMTWDTLLIGGGYRSILIDPANHNVIYALPGGIIKSEDGGQTWQPIINGIKLVPGETRLMSLAINPKNSNTLYAGTGGFYGGNLYKSFDGGLHWNKVPSDSLKDGVTNIAVDPVDTNNIYAGTAGSGILWKSTDASVTWSRTGLGEIGVHDIFIDPLLTTKIYVGVPSLGMFKTENAGISWEKISGGLPTDCSVMKIQKYGFRIFLIGTYGDDGGIYEYSLSQNQWIRFGIDALHVSYYYSDLKSSSNPGKLYFGGKRGVYVMDLNE